MIYLLINLFLAVAWMLLNGSYSSVSFITGFTVGYLVLKLSQPFGNHHNYFGRAPAIVALIGYFIFELIVSVLKVVWDVLTPTHMSEPDIVHVPLDVSTDLEIMLLANMVSLTPGSLSIDVTPDRTHMVVHAMFAKSHETVIGDIKQGLERRILEVTRG